MNQTLPNRKTVRLQGYDYSCEGLYFVTICTQDMKCLFGKVADVDGQDEVNDVGAGFYSARNAAHHPFIILSELGEVIYDEWLALSDRFIDIRLHEFVIMPNHFHGIVELRAEQSPAPTLADIICVFKSVTTKKCNKVNKAMGHKLWQRNYYEHIIRNDVSCAKIINYIQSNPENWVTDNYYVNY
ncbi:transposase [Dysgonomonas sp. 520]|uniref:transposase n=1 Tax=Dysgonomonas sp. 520 TaxID=2302931 RepID=UPI0013D3E00F|nr:transposase [Dysgonomonas sp. 520]NDW10516.1 transposase [Dysgonomonas sp. 520]